MRHDGGLPQVFIGDFTSSSLARTIHVYYRPVRYIGTTLWVISRRLVWLSLLAPYMYIKDLLGR